VRAFRFLRFRLLALLLAALALVPACNRGVRPAQLDIPAPDFTVSDGASTVHLAGYRGQVVLLNFWWSQCGPCIQELPSLLQLHRDMPGLVILAVSIDEDPNSYSTFIARHHVNLITVRDPGQSAPKLFHTDQWPETYVIDRNGIIRSKFIGAQDWSSPEIRTFLQSL
jgi:cytochrome c biogenesis protein CcmG, thiol:disulfide interchange protein DsbE